MAEESRLSRKDKAPKKKRRGLKITLIVLLVLVLGVGAFFASAYLKARGTVNEKMNIDVSNIDVNQAREKVKNKGALNVLLMGVDKRSGDKGRSDALIVLNLDPKNGEMTMVSIPRDTRTEIVGKGKHDKINHAYAFGGPDMSIATVENMIGIDIDYYVEINMEGLADLVDAVGGITVYNDLEKDWYGEDGYHYMKGNLKMNGKQTLGYVRMRKDDPSGDFGRTERQRKVIEAIIDKGASFANIPKIHGLIDVLGHNVATNMEFGDMQNLLLNYMGTTKKRTEYMLQGKGQKIGGTYYYIVNDAELTKVKGMLAS